MIFNTGEIDEIATQTELDIEQSNNEELKYLTSPYKN
jgi:hypothetical protein